MATLQEFKTLQASVSSTDQAEIAELYLTDRESAVNKMIAISSEKGVTLTSDEVQSFISEMNEDGWLKHYEVCIDRRKFLHLHTRGHSPLDQHLKGILKWRPSNAISKMNYMDV